MLQTHIHQRQRLVSCTTVALTLRFNLNWTLVYNTVTEKMAGKKVLLFQAGHFDNKEKYN